MANFDHAARPTDTLDGKSLTTADRRSFLGDSDEGVTLKIVVSARSYHRQKKTDGGSARKLGLTRVLLGLDFVAGDLGASVSVVTISSKNVQAYAVSTI